MFITLHGHRLEILYPENLPLLPELAQRLTEESTPAGDRPPQSSDRTARTVTVRLAEVA